MAEDALADALAGHVHDAGTFPFRAPPRPVRSWLPWRRWLPQSSCSYSAMREQGMTRTALAHRLGLSESVVRRLLNPDHRSHISQIEKALRVVGRRLAVEDGVA